MSDKGRKEPVAADPSWTALEVWVWEGLQAGDVANLDQYQDEQGRLPPADPNEREEWQDGRRRLSAPFVEAILLTEPFRRALHRKGVRIEGAWFCEEFDLELVHRGVQKIHPICALLWLEPRKHGVHRQGRMNLLSAPVH